MRLVGFGTERLDRTIDWDKLQSFAAKTKPPHTFLFTNQPAEEVDYDVVLGPAGFVQQSGELSFDVGPAVSDEQIRPPLFFECSLCLSRACLGKIIVIYIYKWLKQTLFAALTFLSTMWHMNLCPGRLGTNRRRNPENAENSVCSQESPGFLCDERLVVTSVENDGKAEGSGVSPGMRLIGFQTERLDGAISWEKVQDFVAKTVPPHTYLLWPTTLGGRPILNARLNVETAGVEPTRPEI